MSEIQSVEDRVKAILAAQFCQDADEIDLSADLASKYQCDSLDILEIVMCTEDDFGFEIQDEVAWSMKTGQQIVEHVRANI